MYVAEGSSIVHLCYNSLRIPTMILNRLASFSVFLKPSCESIIQTVLLTQTLIYRERNVMGRTTPFTSTSVPSGCSISVRTSHLFPIPNSMYFKRESPFFLNNHFCNGQESA